VVYKNEGNTSVFWSANLFTFVDQALVNPNILQEGEDW